MTSKIVILLFRRECGRDDVMLLLSKKKALDCDLREPPWRPGEIHDCRRAALLAAARAAPPRRQ
jgi:hypothetical protein